MKKEYSQQDVECILKSDAQIPESVDLRIQETYRELGKAPDAALSTGRREKYGQQSRRLQS